jgi:hypothetical protein
MSSELASLIEANTRIDGCSFPTPIPGLNLSRYSSPTKPGRGVQCPTLAIVAQGSKQLMLGDEAFTYDPGHYLVVSLRTRVLRPIDNQPVSQQCDSPHL